MLSDPTSKNRCYCRLSDIEGQLVREAKETEMKDREKITRTSEITSVPAKSRYRSNTGIEEAK
jgi:hypothetical protein